MRQRVITICIVLLAIPLQGQFRQSGSNTAAAINAAKNTLISALDSNLPHISLEYFLEYESDNAPIDWQIVTCDQHASNPQGDQRERMAHRPSENDSPLCVQATVDDARVQRSAMVVVRVGTASKGVSGKPALQLVTLQDENGVVRHITLIDLPAAMRWPRPTTHRIRDMPQQLGALALVERHPKSMGWRSSACQP
ncbi:MAG TPA: hypothetical protein VF493_05445 [Terriglobales bacterium]